MRNARTSKGSEIFKTPYDIHSAGKFLFETDSVIKDKVVSKVVVEGMTGGISVEPVRGGFVPVGTDGAGCVTAVED